MLITNITFVAPFQSIMNNTLETTPCCTMEKKSSPLLYMLLKVCLFHFYFHLFFNFISFLSVIIMFVCLERNVLHLTFLYICIFKDIIYIETMFRLIQLLCVVYTISLIHLYMYVHQMKPKCSFFSSPELKA